MNFHCSPEFKEQAAKLAADLGCSIPDMFELAVAELRRVSAYLEPYQRGWQRPAGHFREQAQERQGRIRSLSLVPVQGGRPASFSGDQLGIQFQIPLREQIMSISGGVWGSGSAVSYLEALEEMAGWEVVPESQEDAGSMFALVAQWSTSLNPVPG